MKYNSSWCTCVWYNRYNDNYFACNVRHIQCDYLHIPLICSSFPNCFNFLQLRIAVIWFALHLNCITHLINEYTVLYCSVLYCTVLYCTVLYCTVLCCAVLYCTVLYCTVLYCTVLYCTVMYCTVLFCSRTPCNMICCYILLHIAPIVLYLPAPHSIVFLNAFLSYLGVRCVSIRYLECFYIRINYEQ